MTSFTFRFDKGDGSSVEKEIAAYRYSANVGGGLFLWEFEHLNTNDSNEEDLSNRIENMIGIFPDP